MTSTIFASTAQMLITGRKRVDSMAENQPDEKKIMLFKNQKELLDTFLSHGAITKAQYDKSLGCLAEKMGMEEYLNK